MNKIKIEFWIVSGIILLVALSRLLPHLPNFSPVGALCLFGAAHYSSKKFSYIIPLLAIFISDVLVNNILYTSYFDGFTIFYAGLGWQYLCYLLTVLVGSFLLKKVTTFSVLLGVLSATCIFFIVSNFGVWASGTMYPLTMNGLITCFVAGLPFLGGTLLGNLVYSGILFGGYAMVQKKIATLAQHNLNN